MWIFGCLMGMVMVCWVGCCVGGGGGDDGDGDGGRDETTHFKARYQHCKGLLLGAVLVGGDGAHGGVKCNQL